MPRYGGGHEDFSAEAAELRALARSREQLIAKEQLYDKGLAETAGRESEVAGRTRVSSAARKEAEEISRRVEATAGREAQRVDLTTQAIERNTAARQRMAEATRRANVNVSRATLGAGDPAFVPGYRLAQERGGSVSQYALRQQLPNVGSRRAAAIQEAIAAGYRPQVAGQEFGAQTRLQAAQGESVAADIALTDAKRGYERAIKSGNQAEAEAAFAAREVATARRQSALAEIEAAKGAEANAAASMRARQARDQAAMAERQAAARQLTTFRQPGQLALPAAGQTSNAAPGSFALAQRQIRLPSAVQSVNPLADAQARARQAEAMGDLSTASRIYSQELGDEARASLLARSARLDQYYAQGAAQASRLAASTRQAGIEFYPLSQAMHRHGALTSEFIAAAARGQVTLKELGNQALITAGKFGGWTAAATGVFAVVSALGQVGQGAIQASSGVDQAFRVITEGRDTDALQSAFVGLSRQFNVPVDQAADAVYRMGQVFHNQADAVNAAQAALYSYKTGEVDVETSTKNLIAIQRGFGLSSNELVNIFDQINQAQNTFGIAIGNTEAGLARAAGTFRNSGGDLDYLLALFVAIQKATGESGNTIGTGIARAVNQIANPSNQEKLRGQGVEVDPDNLQATVQSAMVAAKNSNADLRAIATGLFGNQYARLIAPVLRDQTTLNQAIGDTSPEASKGSAQKELARVLHQVDEQISAIGNHFQRLGALLAQSGAFSGVGLVLKTLNGVLSVTEHIVEAFNKIPQPLRSGLLLLGQMYATVRLLQRFGATERFAGGSLGFLANPQQRVRTQALAGLRENRQVAFNRLESYGTRNVEAAIAADVSSQRALGFQPRVQAVRGLDVTDPKRIQVEGEAARLGQEARTAEAKLARTTAELDAARVIARRSEEDLAAVERATAAKTEAVLAQRGIAYPRQLDQPNTLGTEPAPGSPGAGQTIIAGPGGAVGRESDLKAQAARTSRAGQYIEMRSLEMAAGMRVMAESEGRVTGAWKPLASATEKTGSTLAKSANALAGVKAPVGALPGRIAGLAAALGPLDIALIGYLGFEVLGSLTDGINKRLDDAEKFVSGFTGNTVKAQKELEQRAKDLQRPRSERRGTLGALGLDDEVDLLSDLLHPGRTASQGFTFQREARLKQEAQDLTDEAKQRRQLQDQARAQGRPVAQQTAGQLVSQVKADAEARKKGLISMEEFDRRMKDHAVEAKTLLDPTKKQIDAANRAIADANRSAGTVGYARSLQALDEKGLQQQVQGTVASIGIGGLTKGNLSQLKTQYDEAKRRWGGKDDATSLQNLNTARNAYFQAITGEVDKELQLDLLQARNEQQRQAAFQRAAQRLRGAETRVTTDGLATQNGLKDVQNAQQAHADQAGDEDTAPRGTNSDLLHGAPGNIQRSGARSGLEEEAKQLTKRRGEVRKAVKAENRELTQAELELQQRAFEDRQAGREIVQNLQLSRTQDPLKQSAIRLQFARKQVQDAQREFGTSSRQYRQALTDLQNARTQQAQAILSSVEADNALLLARAGNDPVSQANAAVTAAQNTLAVMRNSPTRFDPNQVKQQQAALIQAQNQQQEATLQAFRDRQAALADLAISQTDDPVRQAQLEVQKARSALSGTSGTEKIQAMAEYNNARRSYRDAQIQSREDDINFKLSMDRITTDQAATQLEQLAHANNISKAKKRELLLQAKQLRDQSSSGDFELDLGNIRLPTAYEVHRAVKEGARSVKQNSVSVTNSPTVQVYLAPGDDGSTVVRTLDNYLGTTARSAMRAGGEIGV